MARILLIFLGLLGLTGVLFWVSRVSTTPVAGTGEAAKLSGATGDSASTAAAAAVTAPLFGAVTVDTKGAAKITGKANPGDEVTLLVDEKAAGVQTAGTDGAWSFAVDVPPKSGEQILAVTSRNAKGETQLVGDRVKISAPAKDGETPEVVLVAQNGATTVLQKAGELGAPSQGITVEKAETAGEGKVSLAGKGDPGAKVLALIGGEPVGEATVGPDGAWAIDGVAKATGSLRIEMKDEAGKDKDRIDLPFTVASAAPAAAAAAATDAKAAEEAKAKEAADAKAKAEADAKAAEEAKAKEAADAKAKAEAEAKAAEEAKAKEAADAKAAEDAKAKEAANAKAEADAKAAEDAKAKDVADAKAKAEADAKAAEEAKAKEVADAKAKADAEAKAKADEIALATKLAEDAAKKAAAEAAAKVAGAMNPAAGDVAGSLSKAVDAVTKATDGPTARPQAAKRKAVRGSRKARARAAERQFVYRYVRMTETRMVTVRRGDSLHRIAQRKLGDGDRWVEIRRANGRVIRNPNLIVPGQKIRVNVTTVRKVAVPAKKVRHKKIRRHRGR
jgi:nucleoid-associated protein YgaU